MPVTTDGKTNDYSIFIDNISCGCLTCNVYILKMFYHNNCRRGPTKENV